ncbi:hypothetical protein AB3S75_015440 [Citrus x aurantiifolia]
MLTNLKVCDK